MVAILALAPLAAPECEAIEAGPLDPRKDSETPLLVLVKALIERRRRIGIALERGAAGGERVSSVLGALDRIGRLVGAQGVELAGAQCREIAIGLLEGGPRLFLIGRQAQPGMQPGDAGIEEGSAVIGTKLLAPPEIRTRWRLLGHGGCTDHERQRGRTRHDGLEHGDLPRNIFVAAMR